MPIGTFARIVGLTASALRFYDDVGILRPERVDAQTGYRFYSDSQVASAHRLSQLRDIGMPLADVTRFFGSDNAESLRILGDHMSKVSAKTAQMQRSAARLKDSLGADASLTLCSLPGPVLASAVDQILTAAAVDPDFPVLNGVRLVVAPDSVSLAATDRYRFAMRTLVPLQPASTDWSGTVSGDDLRNAVSVIRRSATVTLTAAGNLLCLRLSDGSVSHCQLTDEAYPDFQQLVGSLATATHRCTVDKRQILRVLEQQQAEHVCLRVDSGRLRLLRPDGDVDLDGTADGSELTLWFEMTTLYPALASAVGDDLLLDLRGTDQPAVLRSADDGDFTTIVMPCREPAE